MKNLFICIFSTLCAITCAYATESATGSATENSISSSQPSTICLAESINLFAPLNKLELDAFVKLLEQDFYNEKSDYSGMTKQFSWEIGPNAEAVVRLLEVTHDKRILEILTRSADFLMSMQNNPKTSNKKDFLTRISAPVWYWELPTPKNDEELNDIRSAKVRKKLTKYNPQSRDTVYFSDPLSNGAGYMFISRLALYIVKHPEIQQLSPSYGDSIFKAAGITYLEKAQTWLAMAKRSMDYFNHSFWLNKEKNMWYQADTEAFGKFSSSLRGDPLAFNRYLKHNLGYHYTASALEIFSPKEHTDWIETSRGIVQSGINFWRKHLIIEKDNQQSFYLWQYRQAEGNRMEDTGHLVFDLNALSAFASSGLYNISQQDIRAIANTLLYKAYNATKQSPYRLMSGPSASDLRDKKDRSYVLPGFLVMAQHDSRIYQAFAEKSLATVKLYLNRDKIKNRVIPLSAKLLAAKAQSYGVEL